MVLTRPQCKLCGNVHAHVDEVVAGCRCCEGRCRQVEKQLVLTESVMIHMLADIDQIVTEMQLDPEARSIDDWGNMLRHAVDGEDYKR